MDERRERYNILVSNILQNKAKVGQGLWEIGLALKEITERELWCLEFDSFDEFLEKKIEISKRTAYRCIEVVSEFTLKDFCKWGLYKLELINRAFPQETGVETKKEFMEEASAEFGKPIEPQIQDFKLEKGIEQIIRFKGQVGIPTKNTEENELKLIRQAQQILQFKEGLIESIHNWLKVAKTSNNIEIEAFKEQFDKILKGLE